MEEEFLDAQSLNEAVTNESARRERVIEQLEMWESARTTKAQPHPRAL